jgi:serine/threonine-protein kinase HipA
LYEVSSYKLLETGRKIIFLSNRFDRIHRVDQEDHRVPFMSAMAVTEHSDGDNNCSYLEIVDAINEIGAKPEQDRNELFRRIAFSILITNTDDHFRNHGFLWSGRKGWCLSPLYDVNPVANSNRILSTRINFDDASASIELLRSVAEYFVPMKSADYIIEECKAVVRKWREFAHARNAPDSEIRLMHSAFEHEELK